MQNTNFQVWSSTNYFVFCHGLFVFVASKNQKICKTLLAVILQTYSLSRDKSHNKKVRLHAWWQNRTDRLNPNLSLLGPNLSHKFFLRFPLYLMLNTVPSCHPVQYQGKLTMQTWENGENPNFGPNFGL